MDRNKVFQKTLKSIERILTGKRDSKDIFQIILFSLFILLIAFSLQNDQYNQPDVPRSNSEKFIPNSQIEYKISKIVDGDTITILSEDNQKVSLRLIGIDSPEKGECYFNEATTTLASLIEDGGVRLEFDSTQDRYDRYGRALVYVYSENSLLNQQMISEGMAKEYTYRKSYKYSDEFKETEKRAIIEKLGIWSDNCPK